MNFADGIGMWLGSAAMLLLLSLADAKAAGPSHCAVSERTLFSCTIGCKAVSVCASTELSARAGTIQYRFGRLGALELAYPGAGEDWRKVTGGGVLMFSSGGGAYLSFTRPPYRYIVYSAIGSGWGERAGVAVQKNGRRLASLPCTDSALSELGPDLFVQAGIAEDPGGFELP